MDGPSAQGFLSLTALRAEGCGIALGHTFGVKVLKMDRPAAGGFLGLTAFQAEGCGLPLCGNAYKISVTRFTFSVIGQNNHSAELSAFGRYTPYPAVPDFPLFRGQNKAPLCCELLMKGLLFRALLSHRSAGGRWCRKAPKGENAFPRPKGRL